MLEVREIIALLRRLKKIDEAKASEQTFLMLASVKKKHPRLNITTLVIDGQSTILWLENGIQVRFDPSFPVAIWKYPEGKRTTNPHPKYFYESVTRIAEKAIDLEDEIRHATSADEKRRLREDLATLLLSRNVSSVDELQEALRISCGFEL